MNLALLRPIALIALVSVADVALLVTRILCLGHWRQLYLAWNLFLAWSPLLLALVAARRLAANGQQALQSTHAASSRLTGRSTNIAALPASLSVVRMTNTFSATLRRRFYKDAAPTALAADEASPLQYFKNSSSPTFVVLAFPFTTL